MFNFGNLLMLKHDIICGWYDFLILYSNFIFEIMLLFIPRHVSYKYHRIVLDHTYVNVFLCKLVVMKWHFHHKSDSAISGLILGLHPANERRRFFVMISHIGWVQAQNQLWILQGVRNHYSISVLRWSFVFVLKLLKHLKYLIDLWQVFEQQVALMRYECGSTDSTDIFMK